ncbi:pancreatic lipase-related protein 2-like isoform X2 [Tribolium madens]|uniref:pancreatic lipase-related protein 2-like isoform X2 n=1 Tax=Tribolium madens TaxID=41895 RepID=UPI001CF73870|nr:pancreatic lipase-related protein 2-like isoform X2 [Tribolium madens]
MTTTQCQFSLSGYVVADRLTAFPCEMWFKISLLVCCTGRISGVLYPIRNNFREAISYSPPEDEVTFHLYHRSNFSKDDRLFIGDIGSILNSRFNPDLSTKIIIHGWTHGRDVPWVVEMREAMAELDLWNIIVVDWAPLSHAIYTEARIHTGVVSRQLTSFCIFMAQSTGIRMSSVHMIGHSMGAQIAASAGYRLQVALNQTLARISGLDPAAPLYEWPHIESLDEILDPGDASFVDVIHTNGVCSHMRSCEFWTASVKKPDLFKAYSFQSWDEYLTGNTDGLIAVPMGIAANPSIPYGSYFLETTDEERAYLNTTTTILDSFRKRKKRQRR